MVGTLSKSNANTGQDIVVSLKALLLLAVAPRHPRIGEMTLSERSAISLFEDEKNQISARSECLSCENISCAGFFSRIEE